MNLKSIRHYSWDPQIELRITRIVQIPVILYDIKQTQSVLLCRKTILIG
jgi:hypothetical protein